MSEIAVPVAQQRADGLLGASDAAAALGLDRYRSPLTVWRQLRGLPTYDEKPAHVNEAAEWGQALEPVVRGKYALTKPAAVFVPILSYVHENWLRATPDGFVAISRPSMEHASDIIGRTHAMDENWARRAVDFAREDGALGLVQVKTCSMYKRDEWDGGIPAPYEIQVRVEMAVTDLPWCDVVCLIGGQTMVQHRVERDAGIEANILRDLRAFWEGVQAGKEPAVDGSDAWKRYASERMRSSPVVLDADEDTEALIADWLTAHRSVAKIKAAADEFKTRLLLKMSAAGATKIRSRHGVIPAYKTGGRTDWKRYALSLGGNSPPEQYKRPSTTWTLRDPGSDEDE